MPQSSTQHYQPACPWSSHSLIETDTEERVATSLPITGTAEPIAVSQAEETLELLKVETENKEEGKNLFSSEF